MKRTRPRWTISALTIPSREEYLAQLLESIGTAGLARRATINVVYNWDTTEPPHAVVDRLQKRFRGLELEVTFNATNPTIGSGRQAQLNACRTPLLCIIDDDITIEGNLLETLERGLTSAPLGIVGVPSLVEETTDRFKPRDSTPSIREGALQYMSIQGMCVGSYRRLLLDIGGFNPRRAFWGEWTELNLRMWRHGFPTAYVMDGAELRHWHQAPLSPTRNRPGREADVLWGLMCTALEYDAVDITTETEPFWELVASRYLAYAFGETLSPRQILSTMLRLAPRLTAEHPAIVSWRDQARTHPFAFPPFARLTADDIRTVSAYADPRIEGYRSEAGLGASIPIPRRLSIVNRLVALRRRAAVAVG